MSTEERRSTLREFSYGGVVVRGDAGAGTAELVAIIPRGKTILALPKGGANPDERGEQTALREVREETGVVARLLAPLGDVDYHYRRRARLVHKTVRFFLCEYVSGSTADHDHEVEDARWIPLSQAVTALAYPGEREMAARALSRLAPAAGGR